MAFGWAYINCSTSAGGDFYGPTGSLLFLTGSQAASGSHQLIYYTASAHGYAASTLVLTGALLVSGAITASNMLVESITRIDATGSTYFGDTNDDIHMRTGSLYMVGTTAGTGDLYVSGSTTLGGSLSSSNTAIVVGNVVFGNALNVSGATTLASVTTLAGTASVSSVVATGSISGSSTLQIVGNTIVGGTLNVSGTTTLATLNAHSTTLAGTASVSSVVATGSISGSSTLEAVGATILGNTLNVSGATTLAGPLSSSTTAIIVGNTIFGNALSVSGATTLAGTLSSSTTAIIVGNTIFGNALSVSGNVTLAGLISSSAAIGTNMAGHILTSGMVRSTGSISGASTLQSVGATIVGGALYVSGATILAGAVSSSTAGRFAGSISSSGDLAVTGAVHATTFYGSGTGLTGILDASAGADTRIAVFSDADTLVGNPDFVFDDAGAMVTIGGTVTSGISASGPATFVGNTILNSALSVSGATTLAGTTTVKGLNVTYEDITTTLQTSSEASYIVGINAGDSDTDYCVMSASTAGIGKLLVIKDEVVSRAATAIYVSASAGDTIDGQAYYIITGSMASINLYSDGVDKWFIF